ncbi:unnamed protein product [Mesocestoides corti]|uniref:DUF7083 domain-containing protein n=1 Tax=Mesocestoides corti TaxID=53468 RepID=A0A158QTC8_MESCO|nr:unnamed protein product [Mesocestoides corti]
MLADRQSSQAAPASTPSVDGLTNGVMEFSNDPENDVTFGFWYRCYKDLFRVDLASQDDAWNVRLPTRKLGLAEPERYTDTILLKSSLDFTFGKTVQNLNRMFKECTYLFSIRYKCLKLPTGEFDDFLDHLAVVNRECEKNQFKSMTDDQLKTLILICSLQIPTPFSEAKQLSSCVTVATPTPRARHPSKAKRCPHADATSPSFDYLELRIKGPVVLVRHTRSFEVGAIVAYPAKPEFDRLFLPCADS